MIYDTDIERLRQATREFGKARVLVLGDIMLDRFIWGSVRRISPEAPVPVVDVESETIMLGGAANVLHNLIALGGEASLCGLVGDDESGKQVIELLQSLESDPQGVILCSDRSTTVKTRVVAHSQQVVRVDRENREPLSTQENDHICTFLERELPLCHAVIVSDYYKGVINERVSQCLKELTIQHKKMWVVDPKVPNMNLYAGATMVTPNHLEAAAAAGVMVDSPDYVALAGRKLRQLFKFQAVLITQGAGGMTLFTPEIESHIPTAAKQVFDVTGAGDTVISTLTMGLIAGLEPKDAALLANIAAGVVVGEVGTSAVTAGRLSQALEDGVRELIKRN